MCLCAVCLCIFQFIFFPIIIWCLFIWLYGSQFNGSQFAVCFFYFQSFFKRWKLLFSLYRKVYNYLHRWFSRVRCCCSVHNVIFCFAPICINYNVHKLHLNAWQSNIGVLDTHKLRFSAGTTDGKNMGRERDISLSLLNNIHWILPTDL